MLEDIVTSPLAQIKCLHMYGCQLKFDFSMLDQLFASATEVVLPQAVYPTFKKGLRRLIRNWQGNQREIYLLHTQVVAGKTVGEDGVLVHLHKCSNRCVDGQHCIVNADETKVLDFEVCVEKDEQLEALMLQLTFYSVTVASLSSDFCTV